MKVHLYDGESSIMLDTKLCWTELMRFFKRNLMRPTVDLEHDTIHIDMTDCESCMGTGVAKGENCPCH